VQNSRAAGGSSEQDFGIYILAPSDVDHMINSTLQYGTSPSASRNWRE
jgi:hypothetical protein